MAAVSVYTYDHASLFGKMGASNMYSNYGLFNIDTRNSFHLMAHMSYYLSYFLYCLLLGFNFTCGVVWLISISRLQITLRSVLLWCYLKLYNL